MLARLRRPVALGLLAPVLALLLSGCIGINFTSTKQAESLGPVTLTVGACSTGSPGCTATSNTGSVYELILSESVGAQVLLAVRLPEGAVPPATVNASVSGGGALQFTRNASYENQLQALEPAPPGERWWGWVSGQFSYSQSSKQGFTASFAVSLPRPADGGPFPSPMHWRPVVGSRIADSTYLASRPVNCGPQPDDLYTGFSESGGVGSTVVCADSPDEAATRGFLEAPLIDFGIVGSTVTASPGSTLTATFLAKRSGINDFATTYSLTAETGIPGGTVAIDRGSIPLGGDSTQPVLATITVPAGTPPGSYPVTVTGTAPGKPTRSGVTTVTVPAPPVPPTPVTAPNLRASLSKKRFRKGKLRIVLSERAAVTVVSAKRRGKKWRKAGTLRRTLAAGKSSINVGPRIGKLKLTPGRYRLTVTARQNGLSSPRQVLTFTYLKR